MSELSHQGAFRLIYKRRLSEAERLALQQHLRYCGACRLDAEMAGLFSDHLPPQTVPTRPSPQFTAVFLESAARRSRRSHIMKTTYAVGALAALFLLVLAGWLITRMNVATPSPAIDPLEMVRPQVDSAPAPTTAAPELSAAEASEALVAAITSGDTAAVRQLLAAGADPNSAGRFGEVPLPTAAEVGRLEIVQLLLDAGADVNSVMDGSAPDGDSLTQAPALLYAAAAGHLDVVQLLLANGADANKLEAGDGDTALHHAAWFDHPQIVQVLLENGAQVDARRTDVDGHTPLHWAASTGSLGAMEALLQAGADVNLQDSRFGNTPLLFALGYGRVREGNYVELTSLLLDAGADANLATDRGKTPLMAAIQNNELTDMVQVVTLLLEAGADPNRQDHLGDTALHHAASAGQAQVVALLLAQGAALDLQNNKGETALDVAVDEQTRAVLREAGAAGAAGEQLVAAIEAGDAAEVARLLDNGVDPNLSASGDKVPLPLAAGAGQLEIAQLLLDAGADVNGTMTWVTSAGQTLMQAPALIHAAYSRNADVVKLLLDHGAEVNLTQADSRESALHYAAWRASPEIITLLLDNGADPNLQAANTWLSEGVPLHYAIGNGSPSSAQALLDGGADVNTLNGEGLSPLLFLLTLPSSNEQMTNFVTLLLEAGADADIQDQNGEAALHYAVRMDQDDLVPLLIGHGASIDLQNNDGDTALHLVARVNNAEAVAMLIEAGADAAVENDEGQTPLDVAASEEVAALLRAAGGE